MGDGGVGTRIDQSSSSPQLPALPSKLLVQSLSNRSGSSLCKIVTSNHDACWRGLQIRSYFCGSFISYHFLAPRPEVLTALYFSSFFSHLPPLFFYSPLSSSCLSFCCSFKGSHFFSLTSTFMNRYLRLPESMLRSSLIHLL